MLGVPFIPVRCPSCGGELTVPLVPNSVRRFVCPFCGSFVECAIDQHGRTRLSATTFEKAAEKMIIERGRQSIEEFKKMSGAIFCPKCGADVTSAEMLHKVEGKVARAYTACPKCGREIEWASVPIGGPF
jgi:DNA-directed RNA polymerase subunit M/transcription elongation factor TFIIS